MEEKIKIGISGNRDGSGGYQPLINSGFELSTLRNEIPFPAQIQSDFCIEIHQNATEACFVYCANPTTVRSYGAGRAGVMCIYLVIPSGKRIAGFTPLELLLKVRDIFRAENMIQRSERIWEYLPKNYDNASFRKLVEEVSLEELPIYRKMRDDGEPISIATGEGNLEAFFKDFQYKELCDYRKVVVAEKIDGSTMPLQIPRPLGLKVMCSGNFAGLTIDKRGAEQRIPLKPSDPDCYNSIEISFSVEDWTLKHSENCSAHIDWASERIVIDRVKFPAKIFPVQFSAECEDDTIDVSSCLSFNIDGEGIKPENGEFHFKGSQIRKALRENIHLEPRLNADFDCSIDLKWDAITGFLESLSLKLRKWPELMIEQANLLPENVEVSVRLRSGEERRLGLWEVDGDKPFLKELTGVKEADVRTVILRSANYDYVVVGKVGESLVYSIAEIIRRKKDIHKNESVVRTHSDSGSGSSAFTNLTGGDKISCNESADRKGGKSNPSQPEPQPAPELVKEPAKNLIRIKNNCSETVDIGWVAFKGKYDKEKVLLKYLSNPELGILNKEKVFRLPEGLEAEKVIVSFRKSKYKSQRHEYELSEYIPEDGVKTIETTDKDIARDKRGFLLWGVVAFLWCIAVSAVLLVGWLVFKKIFPDEITQAEKVLNGINIPELKKANPQKLFVLENWDEVLKDYKMNRDTLNYVRDSLMQELDEKKRNHCDSILIVKQQQLDSIGFQIDAQVARFANLMKDLEDSNYKLRFDDTQRIKDWIDKYASCASNSEKLSFVKDCIGYYIDFVRILAVNDIKTNIEDIEKYKVNDKKYKLPAVESYWEENPFQTLFNDCQEKQQYKSQLNNFKKRLQRQYDMKVCVGLFNLYPQKYIYFKNDVTGKEYWNQVDCFEGIVKKQE